ncbi:MAG: M20 family metallopeptidase [Burkholderiales bacterium]|nr:M20 family metallopeptidase [Burkholderiales bacterium]MDE2456511.1 M20 family metallopeptidase [Burkholderiales bacterium]
MNAAAATRDHALERARRHFDSGDFFADLARRVACRSESQDPDAAPLLRAYLADEIAPALAALGFETRLHDNPEPRFGPLLVATRHEHESLPTVLMYGHGDVIRGQDASWTRGRGPWQLTQEGERLYGRGSADNKGQHSINLAALAQVLAERGARLGFNIKVLLETGEETGSPGLAAFCAAERQALAADVLIASDGPRQRRDLPTVFLGSRGVANFDLSLTLREGAHHSGNWGGLLRNPGTVLANAIACLVDGRGRILIEALRPPPIPVNVRAALAGLEFGGDAGDPAVDADWGEPGLSPAERVIGWNTLEVLAYRCGNPDQPVNAIPPSARATLHLRHVVGTDLSELAAKVRAHLARHGFDDIVVDRVTASAATRLDPDNPWVRFSLDSIARSTGVAPVLLPNLGGSLPNEVFADILGLPTIWVPHSYGACNQHAPDEHLLAPLARQALELMTGLFWDLGEQAAMLPRRMASPPDSRMASPPDSLRASPLESRAVSSLDPRAAAA